MFFKLKLICTFIFRLYFSLFDTDTYVDYSYLVNLCTIEVLKHDLELFFRAEVFEFVDITDTFRICN